MALAWALAVAAAGVRFAAKSSRFILLAPPESARADDGATLVLDALASRVFPVGRSQVSAPPRGVAHEEVVVPYEQIFLARRSLPATGGTHRIQTGTGGGGPSQAAIRESVSRS